MVERLAVLGAVVVLATGCGGEPHDGGRPLTTRMLLSTSDGTMRPGIWRVYTSQPGVSPGFSTYLPERYRATTVAGGGVSLDLSPYPGGMRDARHWVRIRVHPSATTREAAMELAQVATRRMRVPRDPAAGVPVRRHPWAVAEYDVHGAGSPAVPASGWVAVGRHGDRWFQVSVRHDGDPGFAREADEILAQWRWKDTGEGLVGPPPAALPLP